jgi:hypothetical protein
MKKSEYEAQCWCAERFKDIRHSPDMASPYDWRAPDGTNTALGRFVFWSPAYHHRSVIAWMSPLKGQQGSEISACKLSERVSPVRSAVAGAFSSFASFLLFLFTALTIHA